ncbi:MAG TPA: PQQ-binding-like beta-propeller repeat protein [Ktedonobacterales bacterium]
MTLRQLLLGVAVAAFALAALALWRAVFAVRRRARAGRRPGWVGLAFRGVLIAALVALGISSLINAPPPEPVNQIAPAAVSATVAFVPLAYSQPVNSVAGVSARDGSTRWTWHAPTRLERIQPGPPGVAFALFDSGSLAAPITLAALRLSDGGVLWQYTGLSFSFEPETLDQDGGRVYALVGPVAGPLSVVALDGITGAQIWRVATPPGVAEFTLLAVASGVVALVGAPNGPANRWQAVGLRATDGKLAWAVVGPTPPPMNGSQWQPRLSASRDVFFVAPRIGQLVALDARTGARLWSGARDFAPNIPLAIGNVAATADTLYEVTQSTSPRLDSHGLLLPGQVTLAARDARSGRTLWSDAFDGPSVALRAAGGALLYSDGVWLYAIDPANGARLWRQNSFMVDSVPQASPTASGGSVLYILRYERDPNLLHAFCIFCLEDAWVYAVNPRTGASWWRYHLGTAQTTHITL